MTRALLITNPAAARTAARAVRAVVETLRGGGWSVEVRATTRSGDARRFAEDARQGGFDVVVCYGGDGTAMQVAAGLLGSDIPLGIVPGGTGNLLAGNLRLPRSPVAAARAMLAGRTMALDVGAVERADGVHYFAVACGTGFDAELMARTAPADKRRWKMGAYVVRAISLLPTLTSVPHRVTVDGRAHEVSAAMVLVANCGEIVPPWLRLHADVVPDDGWLDVMAVRADGVLDSVGALWEVLRASARGAGGADPRVWFARGRCLKVEVLEGAPRPVQLDGESAGETPFETQVLPGVLRVLADPAALRRAPMVARQPA
ncbi:MAG TPA: diacylglycerol kinase family protein [Gemmatimonadales bacterium]|nr:diacylglycerol kinase family protein [Gemmatimonadales bacterium]